MDKNILSSSTLVSMDAPGENKNYAYKNNRHYFGLKLINTLLECPSPIIIDITEEYLPREEYMSPREDFPLVIEHRISAKIQQIQYKEVIMEKVMYVRRSATFAEKIRWLFSK